MRRVLGRVLALMLLLLLLFYSAGVAVAWWRGEVRLDEDGNWLGVVLLPLLVWVWWRYFSVFGCKEPACLLPEEKSERR